MSENLLKIENLKVNAGDIEILHGVSLNINKGETHVLMGPNGAGKSTLGYALMGNPNYEITEGKIIFDGNDFGNMEVYERAKAGLYLSFQNPIEVPGITLANFIRSSLDQITGKRTKISAIYFFLSVLQWSRYKNFANTTATFRPLSYHFHAVFREKFTSLKQQQKADKSVRPFLVVLITFLSRAFQSVHDIC